MRKGENAMIHNYVLTMKGESAKGYISTIPSVSGYFSQLCCNIGMIKTHCHEKKMVLL